MGCREEDEMKEQAYSQLNNIEILYIVNYLLEEEEGVFSKYASLKGWSITRTYKDPDFEPGDFVDDIDEECMYPSKAKYVYLPASQDDNWIFWNFKDNEWMSRAELPRKVKVVYRHKGE